jgi:redox-sensitive bicupin YhaK (pirin superfamily)
MTAGSGVLHSEMFVTKRTQPSKFNGFQLWLNLPKKLKMTEPAYQMTWKKDMKEISLKSTTPVTSTSNSRASGVSELKMCCFGV